VLRVARINDQFAHVTAHRPGDRPIQGTVGRILRGIDEVFGGKGGLRRQAERGD
jgi:hypothetical protein